jgi:drug/metabolite transporter (DMT)-like permease
MFSVLALGSAVLYGAADFIGGFTSRRADTLAVVVVSQAAGLLMVFLLLPFVGAASPVRTDWIWGGIAGLTGGIGVALLYRALAVGIMAVVAPVTALCAVAVPVAVAILLGERPGMQASVGMTIAMIAIVLVSQQDEPATAGRPTGIGLAFLSGVAIGLFFLALARTSASAGLWPLAAARVVSVSFFAIAGLLSRRRSLLMPRRVVPLAIAGGIVDMLANLLYLLATRVGPLTVVVTLSSLYPASTVVLARMFLGERLTGRQWFGVLGALIAIVMIVSGTE